MANDLNLRIVVEALLKGNGITATTEQVDELTKAIEKQVEAGKSTEQATGDLTKKLEDLAKQQGKNVELSDEQRAKLREQAFWTLHYAGTSDKAKESSKNLGQELHELGKAGRGAREAMEGLERGGVGGLVMSLKGAGEVIKALATSTLGMVLLPILAAAAGGFALLKRQVDSNNEAIKRYYEDAAKAAEDYKSRLEAVTAATAETLRQQQSDVEQLARDYDDLLGRIDAVTKRNDALKNARRGAQDAAIDAEEQAALAKANPDQRDNVRRQFQRRRGDVRLAREAEDITTQELAATVREKAANEALQAARAEMDALQAQIREAQRAADEALARTQQFSGGDASPEAMQARNEARARQQAVRDLESKAPSQAATVRKAQDEQDAVEQAREEARFRRQALSSRADAEQTARSIEDRDLEIKRREEARKLELQQRTDVTGATTEDYSNRVLATRAGQLRQFKPLAERIRAAAQAVQGEATTAEIEELSAALAEFSEATKSATAKQRAELQSLISRVRDLSNSMKATRL